MDAIKDLEVQRDLLARKCADFEDSQRKMKNEFEQMQQDSNNTIIGLKEQAAEHATQVETLHSEFALHMASLKDRCTQIESQLHESASINVASAKQMIELEQQHQLLKAKQMLEISLQRQLLENEQKVKALEKRNKELQAVSSEVGIFYEDSSILPSSWFRERSKKCVCCFGLTRAEMQALAVIHRLSAGLVPENDVLKQQLAESRARERDVSENLASMQGKHKSLMETHAAIQQAFQQVRMNRQWCANSHVMYHSSQMCWMSVK